MTPFHRGSRPPAAPLSDEEARAQVVDPARQVVEAAEIEVTRVTFSWESCNDQGDPPYRGRVDVAFVVPEGISATVSSQQVAAKAAGLPGWASGPPPGLRPFGDVAHQGNVMVIAGSGNYPDRNELQVFGECRNTTDHHGDTGPKDITAEFNR